MSPGGKISSFMISAFLTILLNLIYINKSKTIACSDHTTKAFKLKDADTNFTIIKHGIEGKMYSSMVTISGITS